jgi:hypothetical protein
MDTTPTTSEGGGTDRPPPGLTALWVTPLVLCVLAILAAVAVRAMRRRGLDFVKTHVAVRQRPGSYAAAEVYRPDHSVRDHILCVVPTEVSESTTVEEVRL